MVNYTCYTLPYLVCHYEHIIHWSTRTNVQLKKTLANRQNINKYHMCCIKLLKLGLRFIRICCGLTCHSSGVLWHCVCAFGCVVRICCAFPKTSALAGKLIKMFFLTCLFCLFLVILSFHHKDIQIWANTPLYLHAMFAPFTQ